MATLPIFYFRQRSPTKPITPPFPAARRRPPLAAAPSADIPNKWCQWMKRGWSKSPALRIRRRSIYSFIWHYHQLSSGSGQRLSQSGPKWWWWCPPLLFSLSLLPALSASLSVRTKGWPHHRRSTLEIKPFRIPWWQPNHIDGEVVVVCISLSLSRR